VSIVLIGFMGAGKSTAARALFGADSDALVEAQLGSSIAAFFDREGEAAFREVTGRGGLPRAHEADDDEHQRSAVWRSQPMRSA
jgi:hypothetical protein